MASLSKRRREIKANRNSNAPRVYKNKNSTKKKIIRAFYGNKLFKSNNTANCFRQQHCMLTLMGPGLPVLKRTANTPRKTTSLCSDSKIVLKAKKERNLVSTCEMM